MKGDFSRLRFDKEKHYSNVLMQQGRVQVDADWNEQQSIYQHRIETEARDVIGSCGAPKNDPGFRISIQDGKLRIGKGRYYVEGILCESESDIAYNEQPDFFDAEDVIDSLTESEITVGLIFLDTWKQHITSLEDPNIREKALGGPDTATRIKTIWQVKVLPIKTADANTVTCNTPFSEWRELIDPGTGKMNARTEPPSDIDGPCLLKPGAGYQRLENQLYRIEVHKGGNTRSEATFKFSRDNGSVVTSIKSISGSEITVEDVGKDEVLGFANGQWVEILDDRMELNDQRGHLIQIDSVNPATGVITMKTPPPAVDITRHAKLRRWDQTGSSATQDGVNMASDWMSIEGGIEVQFSEGSYKSGDYWMIPARTATGEIEWPPYEIPNRNPVPQSPLGIQHHYCRLALLRFEGEQWIVEDCRQFFSPLNELTGSCCVMVEDMERALRMEQAPRQYIQYMVNRVKDLTVDKGLDQNGNKGEKGAYFAKIDWMSEEYVALNGNARKLARLLLEHGSSAAERKILTVGETWEIGDGWTLTANSIDAKATPRQVWLSLTYNQQKLDDKVIEQGKVYTFIEKSIEGESDVPMFVTYVDSIFAGATADMVQLRFSWAIGRDIIELKGIKDGDVICLLSGEHKVKSLKVEGLKNIVIHGCSHASKLIISDDLTIRNCEDVFIQNLDISGNIVVENVRGFSLSKNIISQVNKQKFEVINCSDIVIDSNLLLMEGEGILCKNSDDLKIQENIFKTDISHLEENIPYSHIGVENTKDIAISCNSIKTLGTENITDRSFTAGIRLDGGTGFISVIGNHVETANAPSLKIRTIGPVRIHGNSFSMASHILGMSRNVDVTSSDGKVIFTDNFCESNIRGTVIVITARFPRVWDQNKKLPVPYIWNVYNFEGFFYDLRDDLGMEKLTIFQSDLSTAQRIIDKNNLVYTTMAQPKALKVAIALNIEGNNEGLTAKGLEQAAPGKAFDKGQYYIIGWQAEKYVALNGRVNKLTKLILEHGTSAADKKTLTVGETWEIGEGWTLTVNSIDAKATPRQVWLTLSKDGVKKDDKIISKGGTGEKPIYTYVEKSLAGEADVPVFVTYVDSIFAGATTDMVQLRYTWLISTAVTEIRMGDTYGIFKPVSINTAGKSLILKNTDSSVTLSSDSTITLMGNLNFMVARADTLRFMPVVMRTQTGKYEIRGTVWNETQIPGDETLVPRSVGGTGKTAEWNVYNFAGFYYDLNTDLGKEKLNILQTNLSATQRIIDRNNLIYTTMADLRTLKVATALNLEGDNESLKAKGLEQAAPSKVFDKGQYYVIGLQGKNYVAVNGKVDKLTELILEHGASAAEKKTLTVGETWEIGGGWTLTANSIDAKATPRQVWFTLSKDGVKKDDKIISKGGAGEKPIYTYVEKILAGEPDVPVFVTSVDSIFAGATTDMVQLRYTWLISTAVTQIKMGDTYGIFKPVSINTAGKSLIFKNIDSSITLTSDNIITLIGNLKFKVADRADVLRFYPMIEYEIPGTGILAGITTGVVNLAAVKRIASERITTMLAAEETQNIYLISLLCRDAIFSNNQCTLTLPSDTAISPDVIIAHVFLFSDINSVLASVMGNRCIENIIDTNIFSILASRTSILLGNITANKIDPEPNLESLNLRG